MCRAQRRHGPYMMGLRLVRPNSQRVWSLRQEGINPSVSVCFLYDDNVLKQKELVVSYSHRHREFRGNVMPSIALKDSYIFNKIKNGLKLVPYLEIKDRKNVLNA